MLQRNKLLSFLFTLGFAMYIIYYFIALHLTLTRSFSSFYRWNNYMLVFGRTRPFAVKVSGRRKPGESCINPHLWVRLSGPPTSPHHNHPADPRTGGHQGPPLYRGGMRFTVLSCFFSRGKGKSIILTRKGAGVLFPHGSREMARSQSPA